MTEQFNITQTITIDMPANDVWESTANDFGNIAEWNSSLAGVQYDNAQDDGLGQQRVCISPFGDTKETMVTYDENDRVFAYQIEGMPPFIAKAVNTWSIRDLDGITSEIDWSLDVTVVEGTDHEMVEDFKTNITRLLVTGQEELKHWLETGKPHPRKLAQQES